MKFDSTLAAVQYWEKTTPSKIMFKQPIDGSVKEWTYQEGIAEARRMAAALQKMGLEPGSKVAILSKNCAHWIMADLAIMMAGHISIPIYPTLNYDTIQLVLEHSESAAIFVGKLDTWGAQKKGVKNIKIIGVEAYGVEEEYSWEDLVASNEPLAELPVQGEDDLTTIMYTSGTTGRPKGVMHTVGNLSKTVNSAIDVISIPDDARFFSYLPLSHVAERIAVEIHGLYRGVTFSFPESLDTFAADLEVAQPHLFFAVPRIWSKFQEKILEKMPQKKLNTLLSIPIISGIVKKKIVGKLGLSEATFCASGAAPIATSVQDWFQKLGVTIHQCYGMTEDCILSHYNLVGSNKPGSVGRPLPTIESKLSPEGEICIKSDVLMKGYYKEPELTAEMFDDEGFLKTGDIGEYDHDGYLFITGRVKDQFKTDKGKYISPSPIELELLKNNDIEQICLVGMGIPQPIALVIISESAKAKSKEEVEAGFLSTIAQVNAHLDKHEKVEKVVLMKEEWSVDNGLLTPTLKVKRNQVEKIHMAMYKEWFEREEKVIYE
jgi:long-chain acyl-CoA synthetase